MSHPHRTLCLTPVRSTYSITKHISFSVLVRKESNYYFLLSLQGCGSGLHWSRNSENPAMKIHSQWLIFFGSTQSTLNDAHGIPSIVPLDDHHWIYDRKLIFRENNDGHPPKMGYHSVAWEKGLGQLLGLLLPQLEGWQELEVVVVESTVPGDPVCQHK